MSGKDIKQHKQYDWYLERVTMISQSKLWTAWKYNESFGRQ